ncbi:hypothetical protein [Paenibacillus sambharensis]|nr:hypothetical protein [Paenibacillus sambharensis]
MDELISVDGKDGLARDILTKLTHAISREWPILLPNETERRYSAENQRK